MTKLTKLTKSGVKWSKLSKWSCKYFAQYHSIFNRTMC